MSDERELKKLQDAFPGIWVREDGAFRYESFGMYWEPGDVESDLSYEEGMVRAPNTDGRVLIRGNDYGRGEAKLKLSQIQALADYITAIDSSLAAARICAEREAAAALRTPEVEKDTIQDRVEPLLDPTQQVPDQSSSQEIPEGFTKLGANVGCNCVNEYQDKHGMRWCCGGDGIVYTLSAQPDPADLPPPTEAEFNALEKLDGIGALDVCEDGTLVDQYDEPAPAVSDLVECVGVFNGLSEPVPDTPDATLTAVAPLAVDYYATRELERSEEREKARGLMEKLFGAKP